MDVNLDVETVRGFGEEWAAFDQSGLDEAELRAQFDDYFRVFPWDALDRGAVGFDMGCGSGRWARLAAERVGRLYCVDASPKALGVARRNLASRPNCTCLLASFDLFPFRDGSLDFGYFLGVLHHLPDPAAGIRVCAGAMKPGAPFLVYVYYAFDNRPAWFRLLWRATDLVRRCVSRLPFALRRGIAEPVAFLVYYPLARDALLLDRCGVDVDSFPLSVYRRRSLYTMRTDALDRFGTRLEKRFIAAQLRAMMEAAGLERITFSGFAPYWCAVGYRKGARMDSGGCPR